MVNTRKIKVTGMIEQEVDLAENTVSIFKEQYETFQNNYYSKFIYYLCLHSTSFSKSVKIFKYYFSYKKFKMKLLCIKVQVIKYEWRHGY